MCYSNTGKRQHLPFCSSPTKQPHHVSPSSNCTKEKPGDWRHESRESVMCPGGRMYAEPTKRCCCEPRPRLVLWLQKAQTLLCAARPEPLSLPRAVTNPWVACSFENQCRNIQVSQRSYWGQAGADERALFLAVPQFGNQAVYRLMGPLSSSTFVAFLAHRTAQHGLGGSARGHRNGV